MCNLILLPPLECLFQIQCVNNLLMLAPPLKHFWEVGPLVGDMWCVIGLILTLGVLVKVAKCRGMLECLDRALGGSSMRYDGGPQGLLITVGSQFGGWQGRQAIRWCSAVCWFGSGWNHCGTVKHDCCFKKSGKMPEHLTLLGKHTSLNRITL
jgi:hypothetical protein